MCSLTCPTNFIKVRQFSRAHNNNYYLCVSQKLPEGPELEVFKDKKKEYEKEIGNIIATITGGSNVDPLQIDLEDVTVEEMMDEVVNSMERK